MPKSCARPRAIQEFLVSCMGVHMHVRTYVCMHWPARMKCHGLRNCCHISATHAHMHDPFDVARCILFLLRRMICMRLLFGFVFSGIYVFGIVKAPDVYTHSADQGSSMDSCEPFAHESMLCHSRSLMVCSVLRGERRDPKAK